MTGSNNDERLLNSVLVKLTERPLSKKDVQTAVELSSSSYNEAWKKGTLLTADRLILAAKNLRLNPVELLAECGVIAAADAVNYVEKRRREAAVFFSSGYEQDVSRTSDRPAPGPPPSLDDLEVVASRREKQSDRNYGTETDRNAPHEVEFYDISAGTYFGRVVMPNRDEAEEAARIKLTQLGEPVAGIERAIRYAGYTAADTRAGGYGVRICEVNRG